MVKRTNIKPRVLKIIKDYGQLLKKTGLKIDSLIVYGSHAKGEEKPWSDIDVCIVSSEFGKNWWREESVVARKSVEIDPAIEAVAYSPKDLAEKYDSLADQIRKTGVEVKI